MDALNRHMGIIDETSLEAKHAIQERIDETFDKGIFERLDELTRGKPTAFNAILPLFKEGCDHRAGIRHLMNEQFDRIQRLTVFHPINEKAAPETDDKTLQAWENIRMLLCGITTYTQHSATAHDRICKAISILDAVINPNQREMPHAELCINKDGEAIGTEQATDEDFPF